MASRRDSCNEITWYFPRNACRSILLQVVAEAVENENGKRESAIWLALLCCRTNVISELSLIALLDEVIQVR